MEITISGEWTPRNPGESHDRDDRQAGPPLLPAGQHLPDQGPPAGGGCKWDGAEKAWWTGKRDVAESLSGEQQVAEQSEGGKDGSEQIVAGRATYKGKTYYLAGRVERGRTHWDDTVSPVETRDGAKLLLLFRDGSNQFWAPRSLVQIAKTYRKPQTIAGLKEYSERSKRGEERCAECGGFGELVADLEDGQLKHARCCDIPPRGY